MNFKYKATFSITKYGRLLRRDTIEFIAPNRETAKATARDIELDPSYTPMDVTAKADLRTVTKLKQTTI